MAERANYTPYRVLAAAEKLYAGGFPLTPPEKVSAGGRQPSLERAGEEFKRWKSVVWELGEEAKPPHAADMKGFNLHSPKPPLMVEGRLRAGPRGHSSP